MFNIGAEINLLPLSYCSQNQLAYFPLKDITSIVYNREALSLIGVTKDWIYINPNRVKQVFFIVDNITYNVIHYILLRIPFFLNTNLTFEKLKSFLFIYIMLEDSQIKYSLGQRNQKPFYIAPSNGARVLEKYIP